MVKIEDLDAVLPQTQCGECGYPGCRPYAEAMALGKESINRCPPGGVKTALALSKLLKIQPEPYLEEVEKNTRAPALAKIRENECIGCTKCIQACPVDAIIGSAKHMHAIITHECTGCGLCVEPCPVDCIDMVELTQPQYDPDSARTHYQARQVRLLKEAHEKQSHYRAKKLVEINPEQPTKMDYILKAMARVKAKKNHE